MFILSRADIDELADSILADFKEKCPTRMGPIDIERLATDYLGLHVDYETLSEDGSVLGVTAYAPCTLYTQHALIDLGPNTILLDRCLFPKEDESPSLVGRRRFTIAHECAHQILYRYESAVAQMEICKPYACRESFSLRELKTYEDWNEWQADALGASLLMPKDLIKRVVFFFCSGEKLVRYGNRVPAETYGWAKDISRFLKVSYTALMIRLDQLGCIEQRDEKEYCDDPLNASSVS